MEIKEGNAHPFCNTPRVQVLPRKQETYKLDTAHIQNYPHPKHLAREDGTDESWQGVERDKRLRGEDQLLG